MCVCLTLPLSAADIRRVIHLTLPRSVEHYLQEIGRAGRDGRPADCTVLYTREDLRIHSALCYSHHLGRSQIRAVLGRVFRVREQPGEEVGVADPLPWEGYVAIDFTVIEREVDVGTASVETLLTMLQLHQPRPLIKVCHFVLFIYIIFYICVLLSVNIIQFVIICVFIYMCADPGLPHGHPEGGAEPDPAAAGPPQ